VEELAQVIASLSLGSVRPEEEGKMLALLRDIAMQREIGKQGLQTRRVQARHLLSIVYQAEIAEQTELKGWLHRSFYFLPMKRGDKIVNTYRMINGQNSLFFQADDLSSMKLVCLHYAPASSADGHKNIYVG
jgi:hypothetical protein